MKRPRLGLPPVSDRTSGLRLQSVTLVRSSFAVSLSVRFWPRLVAVQMDQPVAGMGICIWGHGLPILQDLSAISARWYALLQGVHSQRTTVTPAMRFSLLSETVRPAPVTFTKR